MVVRGTSSLFRWVAIGLTLATVACDQAGDQAFVPQAPPVTVARPEPRVVVDWDEYTGRFAAVEAVEIRARVSGYLTQVNFEDGDFVAAGDPLFVIDPRPFEIALEEAQAQLAQAEARLELANRDLDRARPLLSRGNISREVFDERVQLNTEAEAAVEEAKAQVRTAELNLEFTRIRAPIAGRASRTFVTEGNLVNGGTIDSTLLTTIVSLDPIDFYFDVDEKAYLRYIRLTRAGQRPNPRDERVPVYLSLADEPAFEHEGYLNFIDNEIDQSTGTLRVRARFDNDDLIFYPGLFARVRLAGSAEYEAFLLPDEAIGSDQSRKFVYVVDEANMVDIRIVELGPRIDELRVIRGGLNGDEWVIVNGLPRVRAGIQVSPERAAIAAPRDTASLP